MTPNSGLTTHTSRDTVLILCLGNDLRGDDGVGWKVADRLDAAPTPGVVVRKSAVSGFYLLDELIDFDRVVVVDAVRTGRRAAGEVFAFAFEALEGTDVRAPHHVSLSAVLRVARQCGLRLPRQIQVVAVEVSDLETIGTGLTRAVEAAVPRAAVLARALAAGSRLETGCPA
jgi:hydrogenase maturation protease